MSGFSTWTAGTWGAFALGVAIILFGLVATLFGPRLARRQAIRDGRVDADGDPVYEDGNSPQANVRAGLIAVGIGALYTIWRLSAGGVL